MADPVLPQDREIMCEAIEACIDDHFQILDLRITSVQLHQDNGLFERIDLSVDHRLAISPPIPIRPQAG